MFVAAFYVYSFREKSFDITVEHHDKIFDKKIMITMRKKKTTEIKSKKKNSKYNNLERAKIGLYKERDLRIELNNRKNWCQKKKNVHEER